MSEAAECEKPAHHLASKIPKSRSFSSKKKNCKKKKKERKTKSSPITKQYYLVGCFSYCDVVGMQILFIPHHQISISVRIFQKTFLLPQSFT